MDSEKIKQSLWGAVGGAVVLAVVGFTWSGWVTGGTAQSIADEAAQEAVVARLAPICVEQFKQDSQKDQKLIAMKAGNSWDRSDYIEKQNWATMPGEKNPDDGVARKCGELLMQLSQ